MSDESRVPTCGEILESIARRVRGGHAIAGRELLDLVPLVHDAEVRLDERRTIIDELKAKVDQANAESSRFEDDRTEAREQRDAAYIELERLIRFMPSHTLLDDARALLVKVGRDSAAEHYAGELAKARGMDAPSPSTGRETR